MKVTIHLQDDLRAKLVELAAQRGERGISKLVQEAVVRYLDELDRVTAMAQQADSSRLDRLRARAQELLLWLHQGYGQASALLRTRFGRAAT